MGSDEKTFRLCRPYRAGSIFGWLPHPSGFASRVGYVGDAPNGAADFLLSPFSLADRSSQWFAQRVRKPTSGMAEAREPLQPRTRSRAMSAITRDHGDFLEALRQLFVEARKLQAGQVAGFFFKGLVSRNDAGCEGALDVAGGEEPRERCAP